MRKCRGGEWGEIHERKGEILEGREGKLDRSPVLAQRAGLRRGRRGSLAVLLLAERARSEGARSTRAFEDRPGHPSSHFVEVIY